VTWLPFDLHPEYPPQGIPRAELYARYGAGHTERLKAAFAALELIYNPPADFVPNTMRALRLTELAREHDLHQPFHDRLMQAYWEQAIDIGEPGELRRLATEAGLDEADVAQVIDGDAYGERVLDATRQAQSIGVTGIPGFLVDRRLLILGAQPRAVFEQAFESLAQ
jgi:predicted DsbA family dithiol-disulfide isomerase